MGFEDAFYWLIAAAYAAVWIAAFVTLFRMPAGAWSSQVERYLMLGWLVFWGVIGAGVWFFGVRPILRERLAERQADSMADAPTEAWRLTHLT